MLNVKCVCCHNVNSHLLLMLLLCTVCQRSCCCHQLLLFCSVFAFMLSFLSHCNHLVYIFFWFTASFAQITIEQYTNTQNHCQLHGKCTRAVHTLKMLNVYRQFSSSLSLSLLFIDSFLLLFFPLQVARNYHLIIQLMSVILSSLCDRFMFCVYVCYI